MRELSRRPIDERESRRVILRDLSGTVLQQSLSQLYRRPVLASALREAKRINRVTYFSSRPLVPGRFELAMLLNRKRLLGCGVEVGVKQGDFSHAVLETWKGRHLISVDPWLQAPPREYLDVANLPQAEQEEFYQQTLRRLVPFLERSTIWRMTGAQAAGRLPHHSLDFVYLDARHDQESVLQDLQDWFEKVRPGGVLAGHDYLDGSFPEGEFGVRSAVDAFFAARALRVGATFADPPWPSWFVLLPPG